MDWIDWQNIADCAYYSPNILEFLNTSEAPLNQETGIPIACLGGLPLAESDTANGTENQEKILVIEDDNDILEMTSGYLAESGYLVDPAANGDDGWELARKNDYAVIILDWKFPGVLSGLAFLNRLRAAPGKQTTPVIVISGFLSKKDFSFLKEFAFTDKLEKPFSVAHLGKVMAMLTAEAAWYNKRESFLMAAFRDLEDKIDDEGIAAIRTTIATSPRPARLMLTAGRYLREKAEYGYAEQLLMAGLKMDPTSPMLFNELGKVYLQMSRFAEARKALLKAQELSPDNIERLCSLGNLSLRDHDVAQAQSYFDQASAIDATNDLSVSGQALCRNVDHFLRNHPTDAIPNSYAGLLNAIGIMMVQEGDFAEGLEHYKAALTHLERDSLKAKLAFNLGLGYLRWQKEDLALPWFKLASNLQPGFSKCLHQLERLKQKHGILADAEIADITLAGGSTTTAPAAGISTAATSQTADLPETPDDLGSSLAVGDDEKFLVERCPMIQDLFQFYIQEGIYTKGQLAVLKELLSEYGPGKLTEAIIYGIKERRATALAMANFLDNQRTQKAG